MTAKSAWFAFAAKNVRCCALIAGWLATCSACLALPSYARQTGMQCIACHTDIPVLTTLGREFKLSGYTLSTEQTELPPLAVLLQPSFTRTESPQAGGAAPGFSDNNNYVMSQASVFYAGRLLGPYAKDWFGPDTAGVLNRIGTFAQVTYNGVEKTWAWDNTEIRYADQGTVDNHGLTYGIYANNNPTLEDPWNSTPAWGFPFSRSPLASSPAAAPLIDGALAGTVAGLGAYTMIDNHLYVDVGAYRSLSHLAQRALGVDPSGEAEVSSPAPYGRLAYTLPAAGGDWEMGLLGMSVKSFPGRDSSAGKDRIDDAGIDSQFQTSLGKNDVTVFASVIHEHARWSASQPLGDTSRASDVLMEYKATVDYLWDKTYGLALQHFATQGDRDPLAYPSSQSGSPNSSGFIWQANYLPWAKGTGPAFWPRSSLKLNLQYVQYDRFDGSRQNIDGAGRSAANNNTLYADLWIAF